ncbi:Uncharacterised protein [Salmonella enterica subsp. enterica serovar Typhi]|nr:Uncharacterised protein [Salmonella enterica subsp. enterica serovar Typhi]
MLKSKPMVLTLVILLILWRTITFPIWITACLVILVCATVIKVMQFLITLCGWTGSKQSS